MRKIDADALIAKIASLDRIAKTDSQKSLLGRVMYIVSKMPTSRAEPGWINVEDRLPEDNRFVLVCNDDEHMMVAQYIGEGPIWEWKYKYTNYDVDVWDDQEQGPVCWWMPLPEPPKEV